MPPVAIPALAQAAPQAPMPLDQDLSEMDTGEDPVTDPALETMTPNGDDADEPNSKRARLDDPANESALDDEAVLALAAHSGHGAEHYQAEYGPVPPWLIGIARC